MSLWTTRWWSSDATSWNTLCHFNWLHWKRLKNSHHPPPFLPHAYSVDTSDLSVRLHYVIQCPNRSIVAAPQPDKRGGPYTITHTHAHNNKRAHPYATCWRAFRSRDFLCCRCGVRIGMTIRRTANIGAKPLRVVSPMHRTIHEGQLV